MFMKFVYKRQVLGQLVNITNLGGIPGNLPACLTIVKYKTEQTETESESEKPKPKPKLKPEPKRKCSMSFTYTIGCYC